MNKRKIQNWILFFVSTAFSLLAAEFILRSLLFSKNDLFAFLREPSHYALYHRDGNEDLFNEDFFKLHYLFGRGFELEKPNPLLGWTGYFDRLTLVHQQADMCQSRRPVLLYGDSFAMCVDSVECYEDILNSDSVFSKNQFLLNYGVGGYGVDQIYLLFRETVGKFEKPFVVFSLLTTDMDRSVLTVRDAPKPYFVEENEGLTLKGLPLTLSSKEFFENNPPAITSYLFNRLVNLSFHHRWLTPAEKAAYVARIKSISRKILGMAFEKLQSMNGDFVILLFQPSWHSEYDWRLNFLKQVCIENKVPFICNIDLNKNLIRESGIKNDRLFIANDGHPTSLANQLVAAEIKKCVLDSIYLSSIRGRNVNDVTTAIKERREAIRISIRQDAGWLSMIKEKAIERGISVDSMINIEVEYMMNN